MKRIGIHNKIEPCKNDQHNDCKLNFKEVILAALASQCTCFGYPSYHCLLHSQEPLGTHCIQNQNSRQHQNAFSHLEKRGNRINERKESVNAVHFDHIILVSSASGSAVSSKLNTPKIAFHLFMSLCQTCPTIWRPSSLDIFLLTFSDFKLCFEDSWSLKPSLNIFRCLGARHIGSGIGWCVQPCGLFNLRHCSRC